MNEFMTKLYEQAANTFLQTDAPDGLYRAFSNLTCECCGELIAAPTALIVRNGVVDEETLMDVGSELVEQHPDYVVLQSVAWNGGDSFALTFREDMSNNLIYFN